MSGGGSVLERVALVLSLPLPVSLPVAADLLGCHVQLAGDVLEAVAILIGEDDGATQFCTCSSTQGQRVLLGLLVRLSGD